MSRKTSPQRRDPSQSSSSPSPEIRPLVHVNTSSSIGSEQALLQAKRAIWKDRPFDPQQTILPEQFPQHRQKSVVNGRPTSSSSADGLAPATRDTRRYGSAGDGMKFDPRAPSPPKAKAGFDDIRKRFGGPSRTNSAETAAATIISQQNNDSRISRPGQLSNMPTAVRLSGNYGQQAAPQIQHFQKEYASPPAAISMSSGGGSALPQVQPFQQAFFPKLGPSASPASSLSKHQAKSYIQVMQILDRA